MKRRIENAVFIVGAAAVVAGIAQYSRPLAFVAAGVILMVFASVSRAN